eukprot:292513-Pleurochrysis_carterae.AAC.1
MEREGVVALHAFAECAKWMNRERPRRRERRRGGWGWPLACSMLGDARKSTVFSSALPLLSASLVADDLVEDPPVSASRARSNLTQAEIAGACRASYIENMGSKASLPINQTLSFQPPKPPHSLPCAAFGLRDRRNVLELEGEFGRARVGRGVWKGLEERRGDG